MNANTIFVSIASYKDSELRFTVDTLFERAKYPENIRVVICQQEEPGKFIEFSNPNITCVNFNYVDSQGICWARKQVQQLYNNEDYFLQLDSHIAMTDYWDELLIDQVNQTNSNKAVFSVYPSAYRVEANGTRSFNGPGHGRTILRNDNIFKFHNAVSGDSNFDKPIPSPYLNAGLMFGHGSFMKDCLYDDDIYIEGEELLNTLKAFTNGYDLFNPSVHMGWHLYKIWEGEDRSKWSVHYKEEDDRQRSVRHWERNKKSYDKLIKIFSGELPEELGNKRTIKDFEEYIKRPLLKKERKDMKLLILGGTRFVGKELLRQAIEQKHDITLISLDEPEGLEFITWLKVNRDDQEALTEALKDKEFDCVIDNIAYNGYHVHKLLQALNGRTKRYVLTSTIDTYQHQKLKLADEVDDKNLTMEEITQDSPHYKKYSVGKRAAERVLRNDNSPIEKVIIRPAVVIGTEDNIDQFNVPRSLIWPSKVIDNEPVILFENDMDNFVVVDVRDVAKALLIAAKHPKAANQVYNVIGDTIWNSETFVTKLIEASKSKSRIIKTYLSQLQESGAYGDKISVPKSYGRSTVHRYQLFDNSRLKELGWKPTSDKEMFLALFSNEQRLLEVKQKLQPLRDQELECIKTIDNGPDDTSDYLDGYCTAPLSKIAIGTFKGDLGQEVSDEYKQAIKKSVANGINVIDTAINYRYTESEIAVGEAIRELVDSTSIERDDVFVTTKGGFIGAPYMWKLLNSDEIKYKHSIRPGFIKHCLNRSYKNLKLKTIDLYFMHNPEVALNYLEPEEFYTMLLQNFVMLEGEVQRGRIRGYGLATWPGLRASPEDKNYIDLNRVLEIAKIAAGYKPHNFVGIELPINVLMNEAFVYPNQMYNGELVTVLDFAINNNIKVFTSHSVLYGEDSEKINTHYNFDYELTTPQKSLVFLKSMPGITSAIVGMKKSANVDSAIEAFNHHDLTQEQLEYTINKCIFKRVK
jgi:aryl-alcohol dehydrogenase-like predicted oxidoreductase/nucleoside-diphosphate-sugar epimerase